MQDILEALDIEGLTEEEQEEMLLDLSELIFENYLVRIIEQMDENTSNKLNELISKEASEEEIQSYIEQNVPGANSTLTEVVQELTSDILAVTSK